MEYGTISANEDEEGPQFQLRLNMAEAKQLGRQIKHTLQVVQTPPSLLENLRDALNRFVEVNREEVRDDA